MLKLSINIIGYGSYKQKKGITNTFNHNFGIARINSKNYLSIKKY